jgi:hypothetical protein
MVRDRGFVPAAALEFFGDRQVDPRQLAGRELLLQGVAHEVVDEARHGAARTGAEDADALGLGEIVEHVLGGTPGNGVHQVDVGADGRRDRDGATARGRQRCHPLGEDDTDGVGHSIDGERLTRPYEPTRLADEQGVAAGAIRDDVDLLRRGVVTERSELRGDVVTIEAGKVESPRR